VRLQDKKIDLLIVTGIIIFFCHRLFIHINIKKFSIDYILPKWGSNDWDEHLFIIEAPILIIKKYLQFPLWNPWEGGGMVVFQHHEIPFLTPFTFLLFFLPASEAIKISIFLHYLIAAIGMYILGKKLFRINNIFLILIPSSLFLFNSSFTLHISEGHTWILPFAYIPFVYYYFERYVQKKRYIHLILSSLFLCLMVFEGGAYPTPYTVLFLVIYSSIFFILRFNKDYILGLFNLGVLTILLSAIKTIPLLDYMLQYPRLSPGVERIPLHALYKIFLWRKQSLGTRYDGFEGQLLLWHEYGCYIGMGLLLFFVVANIFNIRSCKKRDSIIPLSVSFVVFFLLFLGDFHAFSPYTILKKFPIYSSLHATGRFLIITTFIGSLLSFPLARGIEEWLINLPRANVRRMASFVVALISLVIIVDLAKVNTPAFLEAFRFDPEKIEYYTEDFSHKYEYNYINAFPSYGARSAMYPALKMNIATICEYKNNPPEKGFVMNKPLVFSSDEMTRITNIRFTPDRIYFDIDAPRETTVFLNQNFVRGWRFSVSDVQVNNNMHKPSVVLKDGRYRDVYFYYLPSSIIIGITVTIIGVIFLIIRSKILI